MMNASGWPGRLYDALRAANVQAEMVTLSDIGHSFLGQTSDATRQLSLQAWERTVDFIDQSIGVRRP